MRFGEWSGRKESMERLWLLLFLPPAQTWASGSVSVYSSESVRWLGELCKTGSEKAALEAQGKIWLQSRSVLSVRTAKTSCLVFCHVTSVSRSLGDARSSALSSSSVVLSCTLPPVLSSLSLLLLSLPVTWVWACQNEQGVCVCVSVGMFKERKICECVCACLGGWTHGPSAGTAGGVWAGSRQDLGFDRPGLKRLRRILYLKGSSEVFGILLITMETLFRVKASKWLWCWPKIAAVSLCYY